MAELQPIYDRISDAATQILHQREADFPQLAEKFHILNEKWDGIVRHSNACSERVSLVTDIVHTLHRAREVVTSCEKVLTLHGKMPGDMDKHQNHLDKLQVSSCYSLSGAHTLKWKYFIANNVLVHLREDLMCIGSNFIELLSTNLPE